MRIGIDFGTTNSAVAVYSANHLQAIITDPQNENPHVLPSLIYIDREQKSTLGIRAAMQYLQYETGRAVAWRKRKVGEAEIVVSGKGSDAITYIQDLFALVDDNAKGRLLQSIKTMLRDPHYDGTRIFDRFYTLNELIGAFLGQLKTATEAIVGEPCDEVVIGRPVKFSDEAHVNLRAEEIIYKGARLAGFKHVTFAEEPLGVTYLEHVRSEKRQTAFVFDFGGGTLDLTLAEIGGDSPPNVIATRGVLLGGDDLDKRIMQYLQKYFGKDVTIGREKYPFPYEMLELLDAWQTMPELSKPQYMQRIKDFQEKSSNHKAMRALETLAKENLGYTLFQRIEFAKRELSSKDSTHLRFVHGAIQIDEMLTRDRFNRLVEADVKKARDGILDLLAHANFPASGVDVVLRTGGSSLVPIFADMLADIFGADRVRQLEPLVSVVGGMAVIASQNIRPTPPYTIRYEDENNVIVSDIQTGSDFRYEKYTMQVDANAYMDTGYVISKCPVIFCGLPAIRTSFADRNVRGQDWIRFTLHRPSRVYVAYDATVLPDALPLWLRDFIVEDWLIEVNDEWYGARPLRVYRQEYGIGEVILGGNCYEKDMPISYVVVVQALIG
ncbi:MAG: Hsp70 family protein [bacterium]|nr:Hsp70 family protein [bacterium]